MVIQGGANLVRQPPAFAKDGKRLLVCTGSSVTVFSVATGLPVLVLDGHQDAVTSVSVLPVGKSGKDIGSHVWTSSLDGSIRLWDFSLGNVIRTVKFGKPIESMVIPSLLKSVAKPGTKAHDTIAFISVRWNKGNQDTGKCSWTGRVMLFNLTTGKPIPGSLAKTSRPQRLVVSPHGNLVGMADKMKLWVWCVADGVIEHVKSVKNTVLHHTKECRVVAFDPAETVAAGGDETGRILYWHNVGERTFSVNTGKDNLVWSRDNNSSGGVRGQDDAEACTTYHWHASEVKSLLFSVDGTYLFSGGAEGTLVIWQPETGKQQFLPRLGGHLLHIIHSPDPSVFAISCSDNAIRFVNIGSMSVERTCQGIKPAAALPKVMKWANSSRVAFMSQGGKLVVPTDNLSLQFYDAAHDHELFEVQISPRTNISGSKYKQDGWSGPTTFVTHVTFSMDGSVMATVDVRLPEENIGSGSCLKFWDHQMRKPDYLLKTLVDEPHGAEITALVYHPSEQMVVTCSLDATFRVWVRGTNVDMQDDDVKVLAAWRCRSVGCYRRKEMLAAAFSPDGSLLAISAEALVTLWNPYSNGFVSCLACVPSPHNITHLAFVPNTNYLVAASSGFQPRLIVWHLSTLSVLWSCYVRVEALSVDPNSSHFGIIALVPSAEKGNGHPPRRKSIVAIFNADHHTPSATWSIGEGVGGALFFGSPNLLSSSKSQTENPNAEHHVHQSCMVVLTGSHEYALLNPYSQEDDAETILPVPTTLIEAAPSAYLAMYGKSTAPVNKKSDGMDPAGIRSPKPWGDLFNAPSHVLPPLTRLSLKFMEFVLEKHSDLENQSQ